MKQALQIAPVVIGTALIGLFGLIGWIVSSLPPTSAHLSVAGLSGQVFVTFDREGIPSIRAKTMDDAAFGLGFVHARDRLWQMEAMRRFGAGRLSEIIGPRTVRLDRFSRTLGFYEKSKEALNGLTPEVIRHLQAYAAGVNAWLAQNKDALPPEFLLLGHVPEAWKPVDSIVWGKLMALELSGNFRGELLRARLAEKSLEGRFDEFWPRYPSDAPLTVAGTDTSLRKLASELSRLAKVIPEIGGKPQGASNAWVVGGRRSETGSPLLANDPHLGFNAPILWYLAQIETPALTLCGATVPGVPFVIVGQNNHVAWGFTTTQADLQDVFIEKNAVSPAGSYLTPAGPRPYEEREEFIHVKGEPGHKLTIRSSRHGPLISDLVRMPLNAFGRSRRDYEVSLSATFLLSEDTTPKAIFELNRARNRQEVLSALSDITSPMLNVIFAGRQGDIGFQAAGLLPRRRQGIGFVVSPGWTDGYGWDGFVSFGELPNVVNPASGTLANANNKIAGAGYPHFISRDWGEPYRARRISKLLASRDKFSLSAFGSFQKDHVSEMALELWPVVLQLVDWAKFSGELKSVLQNWDGTMSRDSPAPLLFMTWMRQLMTGLLKDEMEDDFNGYANYRPRVTKELFEQDSDLCDVRNTATVETCREIATRALRRSLEMIEEETGSDNPNDWKWGDFHSAMFRHPVFGGIPGLGNLANLSIPSNGGDFTVNRGSTRFQSLGIDFSHIHGSGFRGLYDLKAPGESQFIIATGQSGNFLSKHYRTFLSRWRDGDYVRIGASSGPPSGTITLSPHE